MPAAAASVRARFFGFTPERRTPSPADLPAPKPSMEAIHLGIVASSPLFGRPRHCRAAMATKRTPRRTSSQLTPVAVSLLGLLAPPATLRTITLTATKPATHPRANTVPFDLAFGVPSLRMTAMMGTGLSATPIADGRRLPMAWLSMMESVFAVVRRAGRGNGASREPKGKCGPSLAESMAANRRQPRDAGTRPVVPVRSRRSAGVSVHPMSLRGTVADPLPRSTHRGRVVEAEGLPYHAPPMTVVRQAVSKVPQITIFFWVTKLLTTAMGEATSDYLVRVLNPVLAVGLGGLALIGALVMQFRSPRYVPWIYWLAVAMVAVAGTMAADVLHKQFGVPYGVSTPFFAIVLAAVFVAWHRTEQTLSIHSITTPRREAFYWLTVIATFALGTAAGGMTATTMHLGYLVSGMAFTVLIAVPAVAHRWLGLNAIVAFWFAYILTRPLGASYADWLGVSHARGGLNLGSGAVSIGSTVLIVIAVAVLSRSGQTRQQSA